MKACWLLFKLGACMHAGKADVGRREGLLVSNIAWSCRQGLCEDKGRLVGY